MVNQINIMDICESVEKILINYKYEVLALSMKNDESYIIAYREGNNFSVMNVKDIKSTSDIPYGYQIAVKFPFQ